MIIAVRYGDLEIAASHYGLLAMTGFFDVIASVAKQSGVDQVRQDRGDGKENKRVM